MSSQASLPPVGRWTRPGFVARHVGQKKPDVFMMEKASLAPYPLTLDLGDFVMEWKDNIWTDRDDPDEREATMTTMVEDRDLQLENSQLRIETEILLHMLTVTELKKEELRSELSNLKTIISDRIARAEEDADNFK